MRASWTWTQGFFSRYLVFHSCFSKQNHWRHHTGEPTLSVLQACDITGGLYLKIPQKVALAQYLLVNSFCLPSTSSPRLCPEVLTVVFFNSGCSCLTPSSARSCCCRHVRTWTTGPRVSAIETSSRSVTCAPFVYQVSFNPRLNKQMWARGRV